MEEDYSTSNHGRTLSRGDTELGNVGPSLPDHGDSETVASLLERMEEIKKSILSDYDFAGYDYDGDMAAGGLSIVAEDIAQDNSSGDEGQSKSSVYTGVSSHNFCPTHNGTDALPQKDSVDRGDESSLISATGVSLVDDFSWTEGPDSDPLENVLEMKEPDGIFMTRRIRDRLVIFLLILMLLASSVALMAGIVIKNSDSNQTEVASQSNDLGQLDDSLPLPQPQPTEVSPTETTPFSDLPPPDATQNETYPSHSDLPPPNSTTADAALGIADDATLSGQPTDIPSSAPTAFFECKDSKNEKVFINRIWEYQKCKWLAEEWRSGTRRRVCRYGFEAFDVCPVTCGRCNNTDIEESGDD